MINFHKYSFLDVRKLKAYMTGKDNWLCQCNPIWLFIWSDLYKPEICFSNDYIFIRYLIPEIGMCYFPPMGKGSVLKGYLAIAEDAKEAGFDLNIGPVVTDLLPELRRLGIDLYESPKFNSYIYSCDALSFYKGKEYKEKKKLCLQFEREHPNAFYKHIKKEDFTSVLEFLTEWNSLNAEIYNTPYFYSQLNMIKKCMDHLYEFDFEGILLADENKIYGLAIGSILDNMTTLHVKLALSNVAGAEEELLQCFARSVSLKTRYISFECDQGMKEIQKKNESYRPASKEKFFATFQV